MLYSFAFIIVSKLRAMIIVTMLNFNVVRTRSIYILLIKIYRKVIIRIIPRYEYFLFHVLVRSFVELIDTKSILYFF